MRSSKRKEDKLFQEDKGRQARERGNQRTFDRGKYRSKKLIAFIIGSILGYILSCLLIGFIFFMSSTIIHKIPVFRKNIDITRVGNLADAMKHVGTHPPLLYLVLIITLIFGLYTLYISRKFGKRESLKEDHTDINTYTGDRDVLTLEEMFLQYNIVPDAGAVSKTVKPTAIVGHAFIENHHKFSPVTVPKRDKNNNFIKDKNGKIKTHKVELFDEKIQKDAYESIGIINSNNQIKINAFNTKYKMKNGEWQTVGEFINEDWYLPEDEIQRPAGVFFVETAPVNSTAIAMTRGNKGQTFVNHTIDMFSREKEIQNMFINDPKGELFGSFHKLLEQRGYELVVLNLLDPSKTHQFNVLGPAIAMARIGDFDKMRDLLNTIMNTFFPVEGDDPFWGQAQQALVKMIIFSLIDYYIEEEKAYLNKYSGKKDESTIARDLDQMWGKVTMFNVYQMLTTMSRKEVLFCDKAIKNSDALTSEDIEKIQTGVTTEDENGNQVTKPFKSEKGIEYTSKDFEQLTELSAFFKLMSYMPENKMRTITLQQSDAINLMAQSEKTTATVYGIALVAMLFFTNGPITAITSASPRQSLDPLSLAFPRRLRFKLNQSFLKMHKLNGRKVKFDAFRDPAMTDQITGSNIQDFEHETKLDQLGWVEFRFKGIFEEYEYIEEDDGSFTKVPKPIYIRMRIIDNKSGYSMFTYKFEFNRGYARTVDGKRFLTNPTTNQRIEQGGTLRLGEVNEKGQFVRSHKLETLLDNRKVLPIEQTDAVYNVRPKAIFSITPPHLADYIKVVIVMVSVLFDTSVGESYITKSDGKPFYKTRNILEELGNMSFDGHGIPSFQTKLSIGLGQGQEYTMILQTLQQLRDVYGESVDKIVSSNTAIFMYLISNDTDMLEELSKQAGTKHVSRATQKNVGESVGNVVDSVEDSVSYVYQTEEEPLFTVNELMSFTNGESMVLSTVHRKDNSGGSVRPFPIHNTRETLMPMAYALHQDGHNSPVYKRSLQNAEIATSSTDRDVYQDIPNFSQIYERRSKQALRANVMKEAYMKDNNLTEDDLINIDKDEVSDGIMRLINAHIDQEEQNEDDNQSKDYLSDKEKEILNQEEKVASNFDAAAVNQHVPKDKLKYQEDIKRSREKEKVKQEANNNEIFLDGTLSINHLRQINLIQTLLGQAIHSTKLNPNRINSELFEYRVETQGDTQYKKIYYKQENMVVAEIEVSKNDDSKNMEAWHVNEAFISHMINVANQNYIKVANNSSDDMKAQAKIVDELFEIDREGNIKQKFIELFKEDSQEVKTNV
ncbi:TraM recognition domain-containing protein [Staphylococcus hominis]|uniref:TraM recognition domain-containing protein n=1 Tax=Staphylococcus hominis TaxID=1290 RepID=UPI001F597AD1|nr:TraM recognition domain-containing protein [Staphylococcus hominis]MCI2910935.1 TraM recognition domain-containing protein [Staphylococcus hominis]